MIMQAIQAIQATDAERVALIVTAAGGGAGLARLIEIVVGRKKGHADTTKVITDAMTEVVSASMLLIKPHADEIAAMRIKHDADLKEIRAEHARAMARMAQKIEELKRRYDESLRDASALRAELVVWKATHGEPA